MTDDEHQARQEVRALLEALFDEQNDQLAALRAADASLRRSHARLSRLLHLTAAWKPPDPPLSKS